MAHKIKKMRDLLDEISESEYVSGPPNMMWCLIKGKMCDRKCKKSECPIKINIFVDKSKKLAHNRSNMTRRNYPVWHRGCGGKIEVVMSEHMEIKFQCPTCHTIWVPADRERNIWLPEFWVSYEKHGVKNGKGEKK